MTNDQYFKLEVNMMTDDSVKHLIEAHGLEGFGMYIALLLELRKHKGYKCNPVALRDLSRLYEMDIETVKCIVLDFDLFKVKGTGEKCVITSPYLNRVMKKLEMQRKQNSKAGKKNISIAKRSVNGRFTIADGTEEKSKEENNREEKNRETTTIVVGDRQDADANVRSSSSLKNWETYLDQVIKDKEWLNLLGVKSGLGTHFFTYQKEIVEAFREHINLHGTGTGIHSEEDIKYYFANYLRPGKITQQRLVEMFRNLEEEHRQTSPYRHETVDPHTGERSYYGNPIPPEAPPRPHERALWSDQSNEWY